MISIQRRKNNAALEANRAAWGYTKVALLFFVSLLVTWVSIFSDLLTVGRLEQLLNLNCFEGTVVHQSRI